MLHISKDTPDTRGIVFEGLGVNINEVIETHVISDQSQEVSSNELERIEQVGCCISEDFDMFRILKQQLGVKAANAGTGASQGVQPTTQPTE